MYHLSREVSIMELGQQWCDNATCPDYAKVGAGNLKAFSYVE
jgi:hypothetical protein